MNDSFKNKQERFMAAFRPLNDSLWRFCLALTRNRDDAKELSAETIATAYQEFDSIRHHDAFLSFLFTVARRTYFRNLEKYKRTEYYEPEKFDAMFSNIEIGADKRMQIIELYEALGELSFETREAIILFDIMGYSRDEVAKIQDSNIENIKSRLYKGRKKLAALLNSEILIGDE
jgi:RNA polymerase sigma-70 factor (ECF subfamily)